MQIKICGLKRTEDVEYVNASGPDYAGFVFAGTKRRITPAMRDWRNIWYLSF